MLRFAALALILVVPAAAAAAARADVPEELLISPRQDEETMRRAWSTTVDVAYAGVKLQDFLQDLSRRSGIEIRLAKPLESLDWPGDGNSPWSGKEYPTWATGTPLDEARARYFSPSTSVPSRAKVTVRHLAKALTLKSEVRLPVGRLVEMGVGQFLGRAVSYRRGQIYISSHRELAPELVVTRTYKLQNAWGSVYKVVSNGKPIQFRLDVEDTVALPLLKFSPHDGYEDQDWAQATHSNGPDPSGAAARLNALKRPAGIRFDRATQVLSVTAHPASFRFVEEAVKQLGVAAPESESAAARGFAEERLRKLAESAWSGLSPEAREPLTRAAGEFLRKPTDGASRKTLESAGVGAAAPLLAADQATLPEETRRSLRKLLRDLYSARELAGVLDRAKATLAAGRAGELEKLRKTFWSPARESAFAEDRKGFDADLASARKEGAAGLNAFLKTRGLPRTLQADAVSYEDWLVRMLKVDDAQVETIRIQGAKAEVTFSVKVPAGHPMADAARDLRKEGVDRPVSSFGLEFQDPVWKVVPVSGSIADGEDTLVWSRANPRVAGSTTSGKTAKKFADGESVGVSGGAFSYAISFGY